MTAADPEREVVRAAGRRLALATATAITLLLLVVGLVAAAVVWREQTTEGRQALRRAVLDVDDLARTPAGTSVWVRGADSIVRTSPEAPAWLPVEQGVEAVASRSLRDERTVHRDGTEYRVLTVRQGGSVAQAVQSVQAEERERARLLTGLAVAELAGLAMSVTLGTVLARRATAPLVTAMRRQRRFVADASHELRTPLTLISTRAQLLERSLRRDAPTGAHEESAALVADTRRLAEVVDDLLVSASLVEEPARRQELDLADVARSAVAAATAHATEQGVTLRLAVERAPVLGAPGPLRRVVDALLDNALGHTPQGGQVDVRVSAGHRVTLEVADDGSGIDPELSARLFERFAHGSAAGGRRQFGLGLALVREVVEAHGGTVTAGDTPGGGATFTVRLPPAEVGASR